MKEGAKKLELEGIRLIGKRPLRFQLTVQRKGEPFICSMIDNRIRYRYQLNLPERVR
jgi:hypothetical protein